MVNRINNRRVLLIFLMSALLLFIFVVPIVSRAAENFIPLTPLPGVTDARNPGEVFNALYRMGVVIAAFLAVFMLVIGGFKYMYASADSATGKNDAKDQIRAALVGLFLVLLSVLLLEIINPNIIQFRLFT